MRHDDGVGITTGHVPGPISQLPSASCLSLRKIYESASHDELSLYFFLIFLGRRARMLCNRPCKRLTSLAYIYVCLPATGLPTKQGLSEQWRVN